jgi:hypothetical protein
MSLTWEKTDLFLVFPGAEPSNPISTGLKAGSKDHEYKSKLFFLESTKGSKLSSKKGKRLKNKKILSLN